MPIILSKTDYLLFRECPQNAWYKIHRPNIYSKVELSVFDKAIIEAGNEVELLARQLFPEGVLIEGRDAKAQQLTKKNLKELKPIIFQAVFAKNNFLAALDILQFNSENNTYSIYEVKANQAIEDKTHYHDLAFQVILLKMFGYKIKTVNLIHLNPEYIRLGDLEILKLFKIADVTIEVENLLSNVKEEMERALEYLSLEVEPKRCCCIYKGRSKHCSTFQYSNPQVPRYGIHDIVRIGSSKKKLRYMIDRGILNLNEIPNDVKLSDIQKNQIDSYVFNKPIIQKDKIKEAFDILSFPIYFLDYETYPSAIPRFDGFSSYQQIPFQYSLHVLTSREVEPEHFEFLYTDMDDSSYAFGDSLQKNIGNQGSVIVWSKRFECGINEEIAARIPRFKLFMQSINSRVYDLMDIFAKQYYIHKDFFGKTSIKFILPVLVPEMSYKNLEIQEGGTASQRWNELINGKIQNNDREKIIRDLKTYCKLDTYAMYSIWKKLQTIIM